MSNSILAPAQLQIPLTKGKFAIVDATDYEMLSQYNWCALKGDHRWYAMCWLPRNRQKRQCLKMHRLILGITNPKVHVDHIDGNGLNNTRANLRVATCQENGRNRRLGNNNKSGYKGVCWNKKSHCWQAQIRHEGKTNYLGLHDTPIAAAHAYDAAAIKLFGEFAKLNFPSEG